MTPLTLVPYVIVAFGEAKNVRQWSLDPRCAVSPASLKKRILAGEEPEEAITRRGHVGKPRKFWDLEARNINPADYASIVAVEAGPRDPEIISPSNGPAAKHSRRRTPREKLVTAFGEEKTLFAWSSDPRCVVDLRILRGRDKRKWPLEEAMTTPNLKGAARKELQRRTPMLDDEILEAFGKSKTVREWLQDSRRQVHRSTVLGRIKRGWTMERTLTVKANVN